MLKFVFKNYWVLLICLMISQPMFGLPKYAVEGCFAIGPETILAFPLPKIEFLYFPGEVPGIFLGLSANTAPMAIYGDIGLIAGYQTNGFGLEVSGAQTFIAEGFTSKHGQGSPFYGFSVNPKVSYRFALDGTFSNPADTENKTREKSTDFLFLVGKVGPSFSYIQANPAEYERGLAGGLRLLGVSTNIEIGLGFSGY